MAKTINITVRDKVATADDTLYVCGNSDFVALFDFDEEWAAHKTKTARFAYSGCHQDIVFEGNVCPVPKIFRTFSISVGVFAGDLKTTTCANVRARKSALCDAGLPADPPPTVYEQILAKIDTLEGGAVQSVNGKSGEVKLTAADIGAASEQYVKDAIEEALNGIALAEEGAY